MAPGLGLTALLSTFSAFIAISSYYDRLNDQMIGRADALDSFDFIVVGAGSAGAVVANRLSEKFTVLLLEAGGEPNPLTRIPAFSSSLLGNEHIDWNYHIEPQKYSCKALKKKQLKWSRGKSLGGSSVLNFLIYIRGHPKDFDNWADVTGDPRWNYKNVLPFFKKSEDYQGEWEDNERYHSREGELKVRPSPHYILADEFVRAGQELGYPHTDLNANFTEGFSKVYSNQDGGQRWSTYDAFIKPARKRSNLHIYKFAHVTKVLINETNMQAYGVEYIRHGVKRRAFATKEIVISAGTLSSPQILMLSGIGPKKQLKKFKIPVLADLPVGQNLQDHVASIIGPVTVQVPSNANQFSIFYNAINDYRSNGSGVFSTVGVHALAYYTTDIAKNMRNEPNWPDLQQSTFATELSSYGKDEYLRIFNIETKDSATLPFWDTIESSNTFSIINTLMRPFSRGEATLQSSDPFVPLKFNPNYLQDPRDVQVLVEGAKNALAIIEKTETFRKLNARMNSVPLYGCEEADFKSDQYWECLHRSVTIPGYHQVGTCAMGKKDSPHAVVDSELRVIGIKGLRVADCSIMPNVTAGNTHAPAVMVGEMASHFIISQWSV